MATKHVADAYDEAGAEYPESWIWDQDGETISGTFVEFTRGQTRAYGPKPIVVLEVEGHRRSVWLNTAVLFGRFKEELQERPEHRLVEGEQITIKRLNKVESPDAIGPYWKFRVIFHSSPEPSVDEMFGLEDEPNEPLPPEPKPAAKKKTTKKEQPETPEPTDDVPF